MTVGVIINYQYCKERLINCFVPPGSPQDG
jgi:hypothetical protein